MYHTSYVERLTDFRYPGQWYFNGLSVIRDEESVMIDFHLLKRDLVPEGVRSEGYNPEQLYQVLPSILPKITQQIEKRIAGK